MDHLVSPMHRIGTWSRKALRSRLTVAGGRAHATRGWANLSSEDVWGDVRPALSG